MERNMLLAGLKAELERLQKRYSRERARFLADLANTRRPAGGNEEADAGAEPDREASLILKTLRERKENVRKAINRFFEGTYGICEDCTDDIPVERLLQLPEATRCAECKETHEKKQRLTA